MISEAVRQAALFPAADLRPPPPGHPDRRVTVAGIPVLLVDGVPWARVCPKELDAGGIELAVDEVRRFLRAEDRDRALWFVPEQQFPVDLSARLLTFGMRPSDVPGMEARGAAMVIVEPPPRPAADVEARRVASFEEFLAAYLVMVDVFAMDETMRRAFEERAERLWPFESADIGATFVALKDGEITACAAASFGNTAVYLGGGATRYGHRGQGAYTALVRARWDAAVERGTPALTVTAGEMSRPILEGLGFTTVGWRDNLVDEFGI